VSNSDRKIIELAEEMAAVLRSHTKCAADVSHVKLAWVIARDLYSHSAPSYLGELEESVESLPTS